MSQSLSPRDWCLVGGIGVLPFLASLGLVFFLLLEGGRFVSESGESLWHWEWIPHANQFGVLQLVGGTLATSFLAVLIAVPTGLLAAIYLTFYAGSYSRRFCDGAIGLLSGIPSIILGLWGLTWIVPVAGNSLLSASLVLAIMITPTFALLAGAALRQVPGKVVEASRALAVPEAATVWLALRWSRRGLAAAALMAVSRALGEAVALSMVAGNIANWPADLSEPTATLTTTLIVDFEGATGLHRMALFFLGAVVMVLIILACFLRKAGSETAKVRGDD